MEKNLQDMKSAGLMSAERVFNVEGTASTKALRLKKRLDRVRVNGDGGSFVFSLFSLSLPKGLSV